MRVRERQRKSEGKDGRGNLKKKSIKGENLEIKTENSYCF